MTSQIGHVLSSAASIIGIEPNADMREVATDSVKRPNVEFIAGRAEDLPAESRSICLITVAQALQWFDRPKFYTECHRVMRDAGVVAIAQNQRDSQRDEFMNCYETLLEEYSPNYSRFRSFDIAGELHSAGFQNVTLRRFHWMREMTLDQFRGMSFSTTQMQRAILAHGEAGMRDRLYDLMRLYSDATGKLRVRYESELFLADRPSTHEELDRRS
jgi:ubiquinone/menaquinone biosynthesis C-methylase UbiE